jgi:AraC-like DNA-binding protein
VERAADQLAAAGVVLHELRAHLRAQPRTATLARAARTVGHAERTLQRTLTQGGTSFREELRHARMHHAADLLAETDIKVEAVARAVGYASVSHFHDSFRRVLGTTPTKFRAR